MSGGGFFGGGAGNSQFGGSQSDRKPSTRVIRTLMINQVISDGPVSGDGPVYVDGHEANEAVICANFLAISRDGPTIVNMSDSTGALTAKLFPSVEVTDDMIGRYHNVFGRFRVFQEKVSFDVTRIDSDINPYQQLYHEVEAAREWFHFSGNLDIRETHAGSVSGDKAASESATNVKMEEELFVEDSDINPKLREKLFETISILSEEENANVELIAQSVHMDPAPLREILKKLVRSGDLFEVNDMYGIA